ncbi:TIGR00366 family protein [Paenalcaligenes niemegkensis]|uniref:short-chain fatty acid transporter n=1 Tax=Paenalcaligenes niemegkensis TaxID=2895469 RepID=UPI001EE901E6|nr:TIGR00366 family protein [Paenalcaligenes niemegkensis]MCQ9618299.1 TIGR00366 family protein [Paenalcaligenes niemegkensis]
MLKAAGAFCARFSRKYVPNPFVFAILITLFIFVVGITATPSSAMDMVSYWYLGFWDLLNFSMQMVAILLFGYVLASSPPVRRIIVKAATLPNSPGQAIMLITLLAIGFGYLSWGLGLIVGAIAAKEVCYQAKRRQIKVHYPLAAAAGFTALIMFNNGFSASAPLLVNTEGHFLYDAIGLIPVTETIFAIPSLITLALFTVCIPLVYRAMHPDSADVEEIPDRTPVIEAEAPAHGNEPKTLAEKLEESRLLSYIIVLGGLIYIVYHFMTRGFDLNLNLINFSLMIIGMATYKTPIAYVKAIDEGITACGQIVLQFPFYAGIMGMMAKSGLVETFANLLISVSNQYTLPLTSFYSAALINLAIPSAGGQWAVQGPILVDAAQKLDVDISLIVMAYSYGDQLTNGIQPMWMLPLLGIAALKARDILGYTAVMMIVAFIIFNLGLGLFPYLF